MCRFNNLHLPVTFSTYLPFQPEPGQTPDHATEKEQLRSSHLPPNLVYKKTTKTLNQWRTASALMCIIKAAAWWLLQTKEECKEVGQTNKNRATNFMFLRQELTRPGAQSKWQTWSEAGSPRQMKQKQVNNKKSHMYSRPTHQSCPDKHRSASKEL